MSGSINGDGEKGRCHYWVGRSSVDNGVLHSISGIPSGRKEPVTKVDDLKNGEPVRYGSYSEDQTSAAQKKGSTAINKTTMSPLLTTACCDD